MVDITLELGGLFLPPNPGELSEESLGSEHCLE